MCVHIHRCVSEDNFECPSVTAHSFVWVWIFLRLALTGLEPGSRLDWLDRESQGVPGIPVYPPRQCWDYKSKHTTLLYVYSEGWSQVLKHFTNLTYLS